MPRIYPENGLYDAAHEMVDVYRLPKDGAYDDLNALRICVQDAESAQAWISNHSLNLRWLDADYHYQSPPSLKVWEGTSVPKANVPRFTVATHINSILAKIVNGMFYEEPPFVLRPRPGLSQNTIRAIEAVEAFQLDAMNFRVQAERGLFNALLFGTGVWKWGWTAYTKVEKTFERRGEPIKYDAFGKIITIPTKKSRSFNVVEREKLVARPYLESVDLRDVLVDPSNRTGDIRDSKFVIHRMYLSYRDLRKIRDEQELLGNSDYELPSEEEIRSWFEQPEAETDSVPAEEPAIAYPGSSVYLHHAAPIFEQTTADPLDEPLEVLERWSDDRVITVINRIRVIRNGENDLERIPFYNVNWWNIPDAFWGIGLGMLLAGEQRIQQGITNASLDIVSLILNPMVVRARGANITAQSIRQRLGGIIDVDGDPEKAFRYQEVPEIPGEIFAQIQQSEARSESVSGANEQLVMGNMPERGRTSLGRTATGASALAAAADARIGKFVEDFNRQVFQPWLWEMHKLNCERLPVELLHEVLGERLGQSFDPSQFDESDYFNAAIADFEVLAGSHLAVKQQMAQSVILMSQLFGSPQIMQELAQINGEYVDVGELLHMIADMSGFRNYYSIVKKMTSEMEQRMQASNPAVIQAKAKAQQQDKQIAANEQLVNQKDINRAVQLGLRQALEQPIKAEAETGAVGERGFGINETA